MSVEIDLAKFKKKAKLKDRYAKQLQRLQAKSIATAFIEQAVNAATANLATASAGSLVIYGEPQSGKTEICLTAKLLDKGYEVMRKQDEARVAPGADEIIALLAEGPKRVYAFCDCLAVKAVARIRMQSWDGKC